MTYKVTVSSGNIFNVKGSTDDNKFSVIKDSASNITKISSTSNTTINYNINFNAIKMIPSQFADLVDFDPSNLNDKYLIMYDESTATYVTVNPDEVLSNAVSEPLSPGLPENFLNQLDTDLDNRISLDAGSF